MIGNVNVPGALAADIASVSSVANEALNKATQALSSSGSGNTELNMELSSTKYYPPPGFMNMIKYNNCYLVASGSYLYWTEDFITWNRSKLTINNANYVYTVGQMIVCSTFNIDIEHIGAVFRPMDLNKYLCFSINSIGSNMTWTNKDQGIITFNSNKYYYARFSYNSSPIQESSDGITWTDTSSTSAVSSSTYPYFYRFNNYWFKYSTYSNYKYANIISSAIDFTNTNNINWIISDFKCFNIVDNDIFMIGRDSSGNIHIKSCPSGFSYNTSIDISCGGDTSSTTLSIPGGSTNNYYSRYERYSMCKYDSTHYLFLIATPGIIKFKLLAANNSSIDDINIYIPGDILFDNDITENADSYPSYYRYASLININNEIFLVGDKRFPIMKFSNSGGRMKFVPLYFSEYGKSYIYTNINDNKYTLPQSYSSGNGISYNNNLSYDDNASINIDENYQTSTGLLQKSPYIRYNKTNQYRIEKSYEFYYKQAKYTLVFSAYGYSNYNSEYKCLYLEINDNSVKSMQSNINLYYDGCYISHCVINDNIYIILSNNCTNDLLYNTSSTDHAGSYIFKIDYNKNNLNQINFELIQDFNNFYFRNNNTQYALYDNLMSHHFIHTAVTFNNDVYMFGQYGSVLKNLLPVDNIPKTFNAFGSYIFKNYIVIYNNTNLMYSNDGYIWKYTNIPNDYINIKSSWATKDYLYIMDEENTIYTFTEIE